MPRDGANIYNLPFPNVSPSTTIESTVYNGFTNDVAQDLNAPRPIVAGGTAATNADQALFNMAAEKAAQVVTNYDSQLWVPGSFRSAAGATGAPNAHAFAGTCYIGEALANPPTNQNVVVEARDLEDTTQPGARYTRQKKAGVWSSWVPSGDRSNTVMTDSDQTFTETQKAQGRENIYAAPFDALAYSGMQFNGSMDVDQPNAGASVAVAAGAVAHAHLMDGWWIAKTGTNAFSVQQAASVFPGYTKELKLSVTTAQASIGSDTIDIRHSIEGYRASRLAWGTASAQPLTIGFWVTSSVIGTLTVFASNSTLVVNVTATMPLIAGIQFVTATFAAQTTGAWLTDNNAGIILSVRVAGSGSINIAATNGNTFEITGLVVLPGIEAPSAARSPLIMRPYDQELMTCRRYYETGLQPYSYRNTLAGITTAYDEVRFNVLKRVAPTMAMPGQWKYYSAGVNSNCFPVLTGQTEKFTFTLTGAVNWGGWTGEGAWTADARL